MAIEINNESGTEVDEPSLARLARFVLDQMQVNPLAELSVLVVDEEYMSELHERWMDESGPTDVLAFPMDELGAERGPGVESSDPEPTLLGDVVLCPPVAARQAEQAGHAVEDELHLLCTHGILHLLGYDHAEPDEVKVMFGLQGRLIADWRGHRTGSASGSPASS